MNQDEWVDGLMKALSLISHKAYFSGDEISELGCFAHFIGCDNFCYIAARKYFSNRDSY